MSVHKPYQSNYFSGDSFWHIRKGHSGDSLCGLYVHSFNYNDISCTSDISKSSMPNRKVCPKCLAKEKEILK